jgi:maltooligosyltrehalose trehalohydrolase
MGQEWAASSRFLFFTDHHAELGALVTEGRRAEFSRFEAFADPVTRTRIPDPQAWSTFADSRLRWDEQSLPPHAGALELYRTMLRLRRTDAALRETARLDVVELDDACLGISRGTSSGDSLLMIVCLAESRRVDLGQVPGFVPNGWTTALTTEDSRFLEDHDSVVRERAIEYDDQRVVAFRRPAALILTNR